MGRTSEGVIGSSTRQETGATAASTARVVKLSEKSVSEKSTNIKECRMSSSKRRGAPTTRQDAYARGR